MSIVTFPEPSLAIGGGSGPICLGYVEKTDNQTGISSAVDIVGLSTTVSIPAGRTIKITLDFVADGTAADVRIDGLIMDGTGATLALRYDTTSGTNHSRTIHVEKIIFPAAGVHTFKGRVQNGGGAGTIGVIGSGRPAFLLVEDITGTPAPGVGTQGLWVPYSPAITQGVAVTTTIQKGRYTRIGNTIIAQFRVTSGSTGTAGQDVRVSLPPLGVAPDAIGPAGHGWFYDSSTSTRYTGTWNLATTTALNLVHDAGAGNAWGTTPSIATGTSDLMDGVITYECV